MKLTSSRRAGLAVPAFTITPKNGDKVGIRLSDWLKRMLSKEKLDYGRFMQWMLDEARTNFKDGFTKRNNQGKLVMAGGQPLRKHGLKHAENSLEQSYRMLEENNLSGMPKLKQSGKVRNHNRYYVHARVPATITRTPSGNLVMKYTAANGSVKQEIVGNNKDAPLVDVVHISPRASNVVYEHALKRDRTPFCHTQNIGFHLAKIGYC
jgi:hypothetical protein